MEIRQIRAGEHAVLRDLRLRALAEDPAVFAATLEEERARPPGWWWERAAEAAAGESRYIALALSAGSAVGLVGGRLEEGCCKVWGMWVDPAFRGRGIARDLLAEVTAWGRCRGANRSSLWVSLGNLPARALYRACGFRETGERQEMPERPEITEERYERPEPVS